MGQVHERFSFLDLIDDDLEIVTPEDVALFRQQRVLPDRLEGFLKLSEHDQRLITALDRLDDGVIAEIIRQRCVVVRTHDIRNHFVTLAYLTDDAKYSRPDPI